MGWICPHCDKPMEDDVRVCSCGADRPSATEDTHSKPCDVLFSGLALLKYVFRKEPTAPIPKPKGNEAPMPTPPVEEPSERAKDTEETAAAPIPVVIPVTDPIPEPVLPEAIVPEPDPTEPMVPTDDVRYEDLFEEDTEESAESSMPTVDELFDEAFEDTSDTPKPSPETETVTEDEPAETSAEDPADKPMDRDLSDKEDANDDWCDAPWPTHAMVWCKECIRADDIVRVERAVVRDMQGYRFTNNMGHRQFITAQKACVLGYARATGELIDQPATASTAPTRDTSAKEWCAAPWASDGIVWCKDRIRADGYVRVARETAHGVQGYRFADAAGQERFLTAQKACVLGYAAQTTMSRETTVTRTETDPACAALNSEAEEIAAPWATHPIVLLPDAIRANRYVKVVREFRRGQQGYVLYTDNGDSRFVTMDMMCTLGMARYATEDDE